MSRVSTNDHIVTLAENKQRRAANPNASAWVAANAGTGKTKVLTDRVLNLLLDGTPPERILCLTFTKAAAAEMANRLARKLSLWSVASDEELTAAVGRLRGEVPDTARLNTARRLFARVLDVPGGMRIETIHAFCQSLLRRFPLEAGVAPHFQVMEDRDSAQLMHEAKESVLRRAREQQGTDLARALALVTERVHEANFPDLMRELTLARGKLRRMLAHNRGRAGVAGRLREQMGLRPEDTAADVLKTACADGIFDDAGLRRLCTALQGGGKTDAECAGRIAAWLALTADGRADGWEDYCLGFLTRQGTARQKFPTKKIAESAPDCLPILQEETDRILTVRERLKACIVAESTEALLCIGEALLDGYDDGKRRLGRLDFDDLILTARRLLSDSEAAAWVLFKLDGGVDHVLIDEAQDTNPDQWEVVRGLVSEFFAGLGVARQHDRTIFAVGDRKQSIYSFQGADPDYFETMRRHFAERVPAAEALFEDVTLDISFRSTSAVLTLVDAVFQRDEAANGVVLPGESLDHLPFRAGHAGLVELWPALPATQIEEPDPWKPPIERIRGDSAQTRLARVVARRIAHMLDSRDMLESRGRPVRAGDILVLVRKRGPFVEDLVRALKERNVPVAGVDRMVLTEQMAVMDLIALGEVLLLPEDDLTLACVLKGPIIGLSEDDLFRLAHYRPHGQSLWRALSDASEKPGVYRDAHTTLHDLMGRADYLPPHELFAQVLGPLRGRERLAARLGPDAADPIDEFMALALQYDRGHPPSLQAFLHWVRTAAQEIKRDLEEGSNAVRIMTVHGSKGLQAPIVFLPDTRQEPVMMPKLLWDGDGDNALLAWAPRSDDREAWCTRLAEAAKSKQLNEYRRLLYVALTRAEDRLTICGWDTKNRAPDGCWYHLIEAALRPLAREEDDPFLAEDGGLPSPTVLRLDNPQEVDPKRDPGAPSATAQSEQPLPSWVRNDAPFEPTPPRPLAPSQPVFDDPPVRSPRSGVNDKLRFQRGRLVHRLLQSLPEVPVDRRRAAALTFLRRPVWDLAPEAAEDLADETLQVLQHPEFSALFGPGSLAEVPVTGVLGGHVVSGQVDRLLVAPERVLVVDFKTNRPPPVDVVNVPDAYLFQMAAYRGVLSSLWPDRPVDCVLVWTDGPFLMQLPADRLDVVLQNQLGLLPAS